MSAHQTERFTKDNFQSFCNILGKKDLHLKTIIQTHGYPPVWTRPATFPTLVLIILEQQVSLASARAAFNKLQEKIGTITPGKVLSLSDAELRACYFSRQKTVYARHLAGRGVQTFQVDLATRENNRDPVEQPDVVFGVDGYREFVFHVCLF